MGDLLCAVGSTPDQSQSEYAADDAAGYLLWHHQQVVFFVIRGNRTVKTPRAVRFLCSPIPNSDPICALNIRSENASTLRFVISGV